MPSYKILYVDDNQDSCEMVNMMLTYANPDYVVTSAETADKALALIDSQAFDLYIFDYGLPQMSGVELCQYIRQYDTETPILFFSAMARPSDRDEGLASGATEYLVKPNDIEKLTDTVKRLLNEDSISNYESSFQIESRYYAA
jgi:DNA-binding response OmpR family regulator